jgi:hypothetical protein
MYFSLRFDSESVKQALGSADVTTKLNFLIRQREKGPSLKALVFAGLGLAVSFSFLLGSTGQ